MKLYHGTSESAALRIVAQGGIIPRKFTRRKTNWSHTIPSNPSCVYLTDCYAPYFAWSAADCDKHEAGVVFEVDTDLLDLGDDNDRLVPDEDWLEQATRGMPGARTLKSLGFPAAWDRSWSKLGDDMNERTLWWRRRVRKLAHFWEASVEMLGTCGYVGTIPMEAITGAARIDFINCPVTLTLIDLQVSTMNRKIAGHRYNAWTRWVMGGTVSLVECLSAPLHMLPDRTQQEWERVFVNKPGISSFDLTAAAVKEVK